MITDWNLDDAKEVWQEEAREEAREKAHAEGIEIGQENRDKFVLDLIDQGLSADEIKTRLTQTRTTN